jgi:uncharacterized protein YndB with AHSA1/START domain
MTVAPIVRSVTVKAAPARAFELFAGHMARWWPGGRSVGGKPFVDIVVEPRPGGRWFERDADGRETQWGSVLVWEPPGRLLLAWQLNAHFNFDPSFVTEVELTFAPMTGGGTLVTLEHRHLERYGADAERIADLLGGGWPQHLANFAQLADDR